LVTTCLSLGIRLRSPEPQNTALEITNPIFFKKPKQPQQTFKDKLSMENYFDVPKF